MLFMLPKIISLPLPTAGSVLRENILLFCSVSESQHEVQCSKKSLPPGLSQKNNAIMGI